MAENGDKKLHIDITKMPMSELWKVKDAIGRSVMVEFNTKGLAAFDEQMAAALVWIRRQREQPELTFGEVFASLNLEELGEVEIDFGPPASAASSETAPRSSRRSRGSMGPARPKPSPS